MRASAAALTLSGVLFFVTLGFALERMQTYSEIKSSLQSPTVPTAVLDYGVRGGVFKRLRLFSLKQNDGKRFPKPAPQASPVPISAADIFQKKRQIRRYLYAPNSDWIAEQQDPAAARTSKNVPAALFRPGIPLLSLSVRRKDFFSPHFGIVHNFLERGREWERIAEAAYYEAGDKRFDTLAGIRLHGGDSRWPNNRHSFRLYFRPAYGLNSIEPGIIFGPASKPLERLVVHNDYPRSSPFTSCLLYDVARQLGCIVPETRPVILVVNNKDYGLYYLTEHVSRKQWEYRFGHNDFLFYIDKGSADRESKKAYRELTAWLAEARAPISMKQAAQRINIENLSRFLLFRVFASDTDAFQGAVVFDKRQRQPRWSWVTWDVDHGFGQEGDLRPWPNLWQTPTWDLVVSNPQDPQFGQKMKDLDFRSELFSRLLRESPEFKRYFVRLVMDVLNHELKREFTEERVGYYEKLASSSDQKDLKFIEDYRDFFAHRPQYLRDSMQHTFGVRESVRCSVEGNAKVGLRIDGYREVIPYVGHYFVGEKISLKISKQAQRRFSHWLVNEERRESETLNEPILGPTTIKLVLH